MLEKAIRCFLNQTYPNKELIVLYEDDDKETASFISKMPPSENIKVINTPRSPDIKLGQLRNMAIQAAAGTYICQWDDDDWYHASRLQYQYQQVAATSYAGCIMMVWVIFDSTTDKAYISNYRPWEGSLFCTKEILLNVKYDNSSAGEETPVIEYLLSRKLLHTIADVPWLYIYNFHGSNTWAHDHWKEIFKYSLPQSDAINKEIVKIVTQEYDVTSASFMLNEIAKNYGAKAIDIHVA
jgi:glycosyltransferase involved in cell wall biosynthesis